MRTRSCNKFDLCDHLELNEGAYFYKKEAIVINKNKVEEVFESVLTEIEYELFTKWQREYILKKCLEKIMASEEYDYILIDTPPVAGMADAMIMAKWCDGAILVIEDRRVSYRIAQKAKKQLAQTGCKLLGAVLNKVDTKAQGYYGKYGYYQQFTKFIYKIRYAIRGWLVSNSRDGALLRRRTGINDT